MIEKRKKLQEEEEEEKIFVEEIEKSIEVAMEEEDPRSFLVLETEKADQMVLLIKCPPRVAMAWRHLSSSFSSDFVPLAKCIDSVDLLSPDLSPEVIRYIPRLFLFLGQTNLGNRVSQLKFVD